MSVTFYSQANFHSFLTAFSKFFRNLLNVADYAMSMETVIVGGGSERIVYRSGEDSGNISGNVKDSCDVVALVFARDKDKPQGIIHFSCEPKTMINCN